MTPSKKSLCAAVHLLEEFQVFLDGAVAVGAFHTRLGGRTLLFGYLFGCLFVNVGFTLFDEADGEVPELLEVVGRIVFVAPLVSQPLDVFLDGFHVFHVFLRGIGVVEAQVAHATVSGGNAEVEADGLGVSYVQVAVGLGREACLYSSSVLAFLQVVLYNLLNEVQAFLFACFFAFHFCHNIFKIK